jgi:hypothetical protein
MKSDDASGISWDRIDEIRAKAQKMTASNRVIVEELIAEIERLKEILRDLFGV